MHSSLNYEEGKGVYIKTFGCQMNELDSEKMSALMERYGYHRVSDPKLADLIVINTCSVREKALQKARSDLGRLALLKRRKPGLVLAYVGCAAQHESNSALKRESGCDLVLGTGSLDRLAELVKRIESDRCRLSVVDNLGRIPFGDVMHRARGATAYVAVMRGCNNYCSYCIVPYVRGPEISRPRPAILLEVRRLADQGVREITLLGQNVNSYGRGLYKGLRFPDLLESVANVEGIERVRFVTSHPKDLDDRLIDAMSNVPEVCESIHLPVQAGSDRVLKAMNRGYSSGQYLDLVQRLRDSVPDVAITSDFIVGFPGETNADFTATVELIKRVRFNDFFSFKYSTRPLTKASRRADSVTAEEKKKRLATLHRVQKPITMEHHQQRIGRQLEVLAEGRSKMDPNQLMGRLRTGEIVNFEHCGLKVGDFAIVEIRSAHANSLSGVERQRGKLC